MALHMLELNYAPLFPSVSLRTAWQVTHWVIQLHRTQFSNTRFPAGISIIAQRRLAQIQVLYPHSVKSYRNGDKGRGHSDCNNTVLPLLLCSLTPDLHQGVGHTRVTGKAKTARHQQMCRHAMKMFITDLERHSKLS